MRLWLVFIQAVQLFGQTLNQDDYNRLDKRFPERYFQSLINTFRLSQKWNNLDVQIPSMTFPKEKVSIMVPGVTREFGTFSIFRRNGLKVEFLTEKSVLEKGVPKINHVFVDFDSPNFFDNRAKFLATADRAVFSLVDDFGFAEFQVWPNYQSEIMGWAEDYDHFQATFGPPRPPAWLKDMSKFIRPNRESGYRTKSHKLSPRKQCMSLACLEALELKDVFPAEYKAQTVKYSQCKCTSSDFKLLTAEKCELDDNGKKTSTCVPCEINDDATSNVCGAWTYTYSKCSATCGFGKQERTDCFKFFDATKNTGTQCIDRDDKSRDCEGKCDYNECVCVKTNKLHPSGYKTRIEDETIREDCTLDEAIEACGTYASPAYGACSTTCGSGVRSVERCFTFRSDLPSTVDGSPVTWDKNCETADEDCGNDVCYDECKCTSTDALNLSAQKCQTEDPTKCKPCDVSVCGKFGQPIKGDCSTTCGPGTAVLSTCFEWETSAIPANVRLAQQCKTDNTPCNTEPEDACSIWGACKCTSKNKDELTAEEINQFGTKRACDTSVCGSFEDWATWSTCTKTCGGGTNDRKRCFKFSDTTVQSQCETDTGKCNENRCPAWAAWKPWGPCSAECTDTKTVPNVVPKRTRYRCWDNGDGEVCEGTCNGGVNCYQEEEDSKGCNTDACTVECEWTQWGQWGSCTPDCVDGLQLRRRTNNEDEGASCTGNGADSRTCATNSDACPVCYDKYEKCDRINKTFCTDIRFKDKLERLCEKMCGVCQTVRKRRTIDSIFHSKIEHIEELELLANSNH